VHDSQTRRSRSYFQLANLLALQRLLISLIHNIRSFFYRTTPEQFLQASFGGPLAGPVPPVPQQKGQLLLGQPPTTGARTTITTERSDPSQVSKISTFAGHRGLAPLASCAFLAPGSEPSHRLINNLHDSVRELLNQALHDWVQIAVLGVAVGSQEPIPTVVVVLRPGDVSVARAKILVEEIVKIQRG
jgi:hypothetical protein